MTPHVMINALIPVGTIPMKKPRKMPARLAQMPPPSGPGIAIINSPRKVMKPKKASPIPPKTNASRLRVCADRFAVS